MSVKEKIDSLLSENIYTHGNPETEYKKQSDIVENDLKEINKLWSKMKDNYKSQLKNNPKSWARIGRGSELGTLLNKVNELKKMLINFK